MAETGRSTIYNLKTQFLLLILILFFKGLVFVEPYVFSFQKQVGMTVSA